jgi:Histidine phosphatase superfamily (branch 1)
MVCLVRHAHAGDKHEWSGRDEDRPLSVPGHREADGLLARLRDYPITRILSSPALRCVQTVEPLSLRRAVPIEVVDALRVDTPVEGLLELVTDRGLEGTVSCGHGEQIGGWCASWPIAGSWMTSRCGGQRDPPGSWTPTRDGWLAPGIWCRCGSRTLPATTRVRPGFGAGLAGRVALSWQTDLVAMPGADTGPGIRLLTYEEGPSIISSR